LPLEPFTADLLFEDVDLVPVVGLNRIDHHVTLLFLLLLSILVGLLLLQEFLLFQLGGQFVDLLSKSHLLGVTLVHETLLLVLELHQELLLLDLLLL
jgi:hypothetical protein